MDESLELNRRMWDDRVPVHEASAFYDVDGFRDGRITLAPFEQDEVGDVAGKRLVHLQCHFGLDTLSWARLGAFVVGLDFSAPAIETARRLAAELGLSDRATFVESTVDGARRALEGDFDVVYTSWGVLIWLPDVGAWARTVASLLRPGGLLYLAEGHPYPQALKVAAGGYVEVWHYGGGLASEEEIQGTYADEGAPLRHRAVEWSHGIGEVVTAVADAGLRVEFLHERPAVPWPILTTAERGDDGLWRIPGSTLPLSYSVKATRPTS